MNCSGPLALVLQELPRAQGPCSSLAHSAPYSTSIELGGLVTESGESKWKQSFIITPLHALHICTQQHAALRGYRLSRTGLHPPAGFISSDETLHRDTFLYGGL